MWLTTFHRPCRRLSCTETLDDDTSIQQQQQQTSLCRPSLSLARTNDDRNDDTTSTYHQRRHAPGKQRSDLRHSSSLWVCTLCPFPSPSLVNNHHRRCGCWWWLFLWLLWLSVTTPGAFANDNDHHHHQKPRILYIVTTLAEYNTGTRATVRGSDRLQETLIPVVSEGIRSMIDTGYDVDLFLVCHFTLKPERQALVQAALPEGVGLQVWNDATPLGYDTGKEPFTKLENRTLHLSRQHRFVIKDKLLHYDIFVNFEDDMLIKGEHVKHFVAVTNEIDRLREEAPDELPEDRDKKDQLHHFHGTMTKEMLKRTIPGFIRVEVLLDEERYGAQSSTGPVPVDLDFGGHAKTVDSSVCCHVSEKATNGNRPLSPPADKLMLWETNILALGVRKMPEESWLDWVVMQRGSNQEKLNVTQVIGDYWTNEDGEYYGNNQRRPGHMEFKYINNQGGWMATRDQLWRWHTEICPGGFLPPYEPPHYRFDGLDMRNVEWYSGAMQLSTPRHACNMQRIIMLDPEHFSKSLIYHSANNKQRQLAERGRKGSFTKANTLLGQLNAVRKKAEKKMAEEDEEEGR